MEWAERSIISTFAGNGLWDDMDNRSIMKGYVVEYVPEPGTVLLLGAGLLGLLGVGRKKFKK